MEASAGNRELVIRRIKAAQALGGISNVETLAGRSGIKLKRLRAIYQGNEEARSVELREIASCCEVPYGLFVLDLSVALDERRDGWQHQIEEQVSRLAQTVSDLSAEVAERALEDVEPRQPSADTDAQADDDPDALGEGGGG